MMRINVMKKILPLIILSLLALPVAAQTPEKMDSKAPVEKIDPAALDIDLNKYYRYANKKCDFSFQLPDAPSTKVLWGEMELPFKIKGMPTYGEVGEHLKYDVKSLNKENYFDLDAYCLYGEHADYKAIDLASMETKLQSIVDNNDLRSYKITTEPVTDEFIVGTLNGLKVNEEDETVHSYRYQYFKGRNSLLMIQIKYNAEKSDMDKLYTYIQDSLIYGVKD